MSGIGNIDFNEWGRRSVSDGEVLNLLLQARAKLLKERYLLLWLRRGLEVDLPN